MNINIILICSESISEILSGQSPCHIYFG